MMLRCQYILLVMLLCMTGTLFAQKEKRAVRLISGTIYATPNIFSDSLEGLNRKALRGGKGLVIIQFETLPTEKVKKELAANGITLLGYIPDYAYMASVQQQLNQRVLQQAKARAILVPTPQQKMHPSLAQQTVTKAARTKAKSLLNIQIRFPKSFTAAEVIDALLASKYTIINKELLSYRLISVQVEAEQLSALAAKPFVEYIQEESMQAIPLNQTSRRMSNATVLNTSIANGGKNLNGAGVVIGHGDDGNSQGHVDYTDRVISKTTTAGGGHSTYVAGNLAGAGNRNELHRGYASKATMISAQYTDIWWNAATYVQDYNMVLTNNSYQIVDNSCAASGIYDIYSGLLDQQAFMFPSLLQVFASGNHGGITCSPYASSGFGTIAGSLQCAKNVITVGNIDNTGTIFSGSSKGPVRDGRIKPEIVAFGTNVTSTWPNTSGYLTEKGTSISAPAVTGGAALLIERYRQLHGNSDPSSALVKALLCNGATDKGNPGPDYKYGFGSLNLLRSIDMLEKGRFIAGSIGNGGSQTYSISIPSNTAQVKAMIYWHDPASSLLSSSALVHDLDLEITDPASSKVLPLVLDPTPANVNNISTQGVDHLNNIEQIVINNPATGNYTLTVKGTAITESPSQEYFIVYDIIPNSLALTYPVGGEGLLPGQATRVEWEYHGDTDNTFKLEYSLDGGSTWTTINSSISATADYFNWTVPASTATDKARVRISKNGSSLASSSNNFTIVGQPTVSLASTQCPSYMAIQWPAVVNATDYEIMRIKGGEMVSIGTTTGTTYSLNSLSTDSVYWVAVRARVNGSPGLRSVAISRQPTNGTCGGSISDNDLKLDAIIAPLSGRLATASALTSTSQVKIRVKNLDNAVASNFALRYSLDGGATWKTEAGTAAIAAQGLYEHTFSTTVDMAAQGNYQLIAEVVNNNPELATANNRLTTTIRHLDNPVLDLTSDFIDNFEAATIQEYLFDTIGIAGAERYDFINSTTSGRLRTFVQSGVAASGSKAVTLDASRVIAAPGNTNYLIGTFNLSAYTTADEIRLGFKYNQHGKTANAANRVWIRGNDNTATPWIEAYNLDLNAATPGLYNNVTSIEVSDLLAANGQGFSSSFQIRWGQAGGNQAVDKEKSAGLTFDDIKLYQVENDMQLVSIDAPNQTGCGFSASSQIIVSVRNTMNNVAFGVPVQYRINEGPWVNEVIPSIPANTTLQYTFAATADFSEFRIYTIEAKVNNNGDSFAENNVEEVTVQHLPLISSFPHLQDFEASNGYWYTGGVNSSWAYGTPAAVLINSAASGKKAWKTNLAGNYNDKELSYLYSPCYDISAMAAPTLSFSVAMNLEDCGSTFCDGAVVEFSTDGVTWNKLGTSGAGINWYNKGGSQQLWSKENHTNWHVATIPLPTGHNRLRLRFVMNSDPGLNKEGIAIDDIHIYDQQASSIYSGATIATSIQQNVSGDSWIDFTQGGALVASIQPRNQDLGGTDVQAYLAGGAPHTDDQYYLSRSFTIKPSNTALTDSVTVRLYFTDVQAEALIHASECASCAKPRSAYGLGVSKYSHADVAKENGSLCDNTEANNWSFIEPANVAIVPFLNGYYAEFKVKDFSEFWLNTGGTDGRTSLSPIKEIQKPLTICVDAAAVSLVAAPAGGAWSGSGVSGNAFQPSVAGPGTHALSYSYTDGNGCTATATTTITVSALPVITISPIADLNVESSDITLVASPAGGIWSGSGITGNTFQPAVAGVGTHTLSYSVTDANGCTTSKSTTVRVVPVLKVTSSTATCIDGVGINLTASPAGGTWTGTGVTGAVFQPTVAGVGSHTLTYTYTNVDGWTGTATTVITVHAEPNVSIEALNAVRVDAAAVSLVAAPAGGAWSGSGVSGNAFQPSVAGPGTHALSYSYTDGNGCTATESTTIVVNNLPALLIDFQVQKGGGDEVLVKWTIQKEISVAQYEVEVCRGEDLLTGRFVKISEILPKGGIEPINYTFIDNETPKLGLRKYRLRILDANGGTPLYSDIVSLEFLNPALWQVAPNPSTGLFNLVYMSEVNTPLKAQLFDAKGMLIKTFNDKGTGGAQRLVIDLSSHSKGVYILQTEWKGEKRLFKLNKQ